MVVAGSGPRAVVTTASYEARSYGVGSAMPAARARRLCPQAIFLRPDFAVYREASRQMMDILRAHVDRVEIVGLDEAYLDLTGLLLAPRRDAPARRRDPGDDGAELLCGDRTEQARREGRLRCGEARRVRRPEPRAGMRALRLIAARPPAGDRAEDRGAPGASWACDTLAALASAPEQLLIERFGANLGRDLRRRARFEHDGAVGAARKVVSESRERTFDEDISDAARATRGARADGRASCAPGSPSTIAAVARSRIKVRLDDFTTVTRARTLAEPTCEAAVVTARRAAAATRLCAAKAGAPARRARRGPASGSVGRARRSREAGSGAHGRLAAAGAL